MFPTADPDGTSGDLGVLRELNREYVRSFLDSDADRYDELVADEFFCTEPNGEVVEAGDVSPHHTRHLAVIAAKRALIVAEV